MLGLVTWIVALLILLLVCLVFSRRILLTPQFVYAGCFLPQAVFLLYYVNKWNVKFSAETLFVLIGGTTLFVVASILFDRAFSKKTKSTATRISEKQRYTSPVIYVERWKLMFLIAFQAVAIFVYIAFGLSRVSGATLFDKISAYN